MAFSHGVLLFFLVSMANMTSSSVLTDYLKKRELFVEKDRNGRIGSDVILNAKEELANEILDKHIREELKTMVEKVHGISEVNFLTAKKQIDQSEVFKIIRKMPKGAVHHIHDLAIASYEWLIGKWTYKDTCYTCFDYEVNARVFKFSATPPIATATCNWVSVNKAREESGDAKAFDKSLLKNITFSVDDIPNLKTQLDIWKKFQNVFTSVAGLINFDEIFKDYYLESLKEIVADNIQYAEIREVFGSLYDLNGTTHNNVEHSLKTVIEIEKYFKDNFAPDYFGSKHIYSVIRFLPEQGIKETVETAIKLYEKYPDNLAGYDLVGQEDTGFSLLHYIDELLLAKKRNRDLPFFFHAGETNWNGQYIDQNLIDALLLGTTRIGHGYALSKHPFLKKYAKSRGVAIEVCPISNQILGLVKDLRNHPVSTLLAEDQPITISSDDPAIWGATALSHDLYEVIMGMVPAGDSIKVLKKLALNSIAYSSLTDSKKEELMQLWSGKWEEFIDDMVKGYDQKDMGETPESPAKKLRL